MTESGYKIDSLAPSLYSQVYRSELVKRRVLEDLVSPIYFNEVSRFIRAHRNLCPLDRYMYALA